MRTFTLILFGFLAGSLCGCGGADSSTKESVTAPPSPVKQMVEDIVASGELGSGSETLRAELEKLKSTDEAKAKSLLADLDRMQKLQEVDQIKAVAKKMAEKL